MSDLSDITTPCTIYQGSIKDLYVVRAEHVRQLPATHCDSFIDQPMQLAGDAQFSHYEFSLGTILYKETQKDGPGGPYYEYVIEGLNPKIDLSVIAELCKLKNGHYIAVAEFYDGDVRRIGDLERPLRFTGATQSGPSLATRQSTWRFYGKGLCPSPHVDPTKPIPYTDDLLFAQLNLQALGNLLPVLLNAQGSILLDGTPLSATIPNGNVKLYYTFGPETSPDHIAWIRPGDDATDIANWTHVGGNRTALEFETEIVDQMIAGSTGFNMRFPIYQYMANATQSAFIVSLYIDEGGILSNVATQKYLVFQKRLAYQLQVTKAIAGSFDFSQQAKNTTAILVDWGDSQESYHDNTTGAQLNHSHSYASAGTYDVKVYAAPELVEKVLAPSAELTGTADLAALSGLTNVDLSDNDLEAVNLAKSQLVTDLDVSDNANLATAMDLTDWTALQTVNFSNTSIPQVTLLRNRSLGTMTGTNAALTSPINFCGAPNILHINMHSMPNLTGVFDFSCLKYLQSLYMNDCDLLSVQFGDHPDLEYVYFTNNSNLTGLLNIAGMPSLLEVFADDCNFTSFQHDVHPVLYDLTLSNNNNLSAAIDLSGWNDLNNLAANDCQLTSLIVTGHPIISGGLSIDVDNNLITNVSDIIDELWNNRAGHGPPNQCFITVSNNSSSPDTSALDKINGTGPHVGEGLVPDYSWSVTH